MLTERRLTIQARLDQIETACDFVANLAEQSGLGSDAVYHCRLAVEEICTNIIEHGYGDARVGEGLIEVTCVPKGRVFSITIMDDAPLFNPLDLPDPDPSQPLWERRGGGWGVYFVKRYMDRVVYSDYGERNRLTIEKRID